MKRLCVILACLLWTNLSYSQISPYSFDLEYSFSRQGFPIGSMSGFGSSGILNNVSNLSALNPAALSSFDRCSAGFSYEYSSEVEQEGRLYTTVKAKRPVSPLPQSVGLVVPYDNFRFGIAMSRYYNIDLTSRFSSINSDFGSPEWNYSAGIEQYSAIASYAVQNTGLALGLGFNLNSFHQKQQDDLMIYYAYSSMYTKYEYENPLYSTNWHMGALYKFDLSNENYLKLALAYESAFKYDNDFTISYGDDRFSHKYNVTAKLPGRLKFDTEMKVRNDLRLLASVSETFWKNANEKSGNIIFSSLGGLYNLNAGSAVSFGAALSDNVSFGKGGNNDIVYLYAGINTYYKFLNFDLSVADSHVSKNEAFKQTLVKFALGFRY